MATVLETPTAASILNDTISRAIGLCYFDAASESLLELDSVGDLFISVEQSGVSIKKFYMVIAPDSDVSSILIKVSSGDEYNNLYSAKLIISEDEPSLAVFDILPEYNSYVINNPLQGSLISVWMMVYNESRVNEINSLTLEVSYE